MYYDAETRTKNYEPKPTKLVKWAKYMLTASLLSDDLTFCFDLQRRKTLVLLLVLYSDVFSVLYW